MKKVKMILPVLAVMFAIAGALATGTSNEAKFGAIPVTEDPDICEIDGFCTGVGPATCEFAAGQPVADQQNCLTPVLGDYDPN